MIANNAVENEQHSHKFVVNLLFYIVSKAD